MLIRQATPAEDDILVRHYRALWESYDVGDAAIRTDAEDCVRAFIDRGRAEFRMTAFFAIEGDGILGSCACQLQQLPYPDVTVPSFRQFGYIWSVFVEPDARRRGVAKRLVAEAIDYLKRIGCTKAVLHSSEAGEELYRQLGFQVAKEMRLDLQPAPKE